MTIIVTKEEVSVLRTRLAQYLNVAIAGLASGTEWDYSDGIYLLDSAFTHVSDEDIVEARDSLGELAIELTEEYLAAIDGDFDEDIALVEQEIKNTPETMGQLIPFRRQPQAAQTKDHDGAS